MTENGNVRARPSIQVPLGPMALVCLIFALACLASLVIAVSVKRVDALSTVALGLAILAFIAQIIVYIVQASQVSEQARQTSALHSQMMSVLAQLQERTQGTQKSMDKMNGRLLEAVLGKSSDVSIAGDSSRVAARLIETVSTSEGALGQGRGEVLGQLAEGVVGEDYPSALDRAEAAAIHAEMLKPLSHDEVSMVEDIFQDLKPADHLRLARISRDVLQFTRPNSVFGPGVSYVSDALLEKGFVEKIPGWKLYTLTQKGRAPARLFSAGLTSGGDSPVLLKIRNAEEERRRNEEANRSNRDG